MRKGSTADQGVNNAGGNEYIIKKGDTLWKLSQKFYGDPTKSQKLYEANKNVIEAAARQHGKAGSSNGYWIWERNQTGYSLKEGQHWKI